MNGTIKKYFLSLLLISVFACGHKENKPTEPVSTTEKDTTSFSKSETKYNPYAAVDISPMDMSYYPTDYPKLKMTKALTAPPFARIIYSRPYLQGRHLFHDLLKYGEAWRLGANEATELQLYKGAIIQNKTVKAGRYVLYCIPQADTWTIVINSNIDSWGLIPDTTKDLFRFSIPVTKNNQYLDYFTIIFENTNNGAELLISWGDVEARLPINF